VSHDRAPKKAERDPAHHQHDRGEESHNRVLRRLLECKRTWWARARWDHRAHGGSSWSADATPGAAAPFSVSALGRGRENPSRQEPQAEHHQRPERPFAEVPTGQVSLIQRQTPRPPWPATVAGKCGQNQKGDRRDDVVRKEHDSNTHRTDKETPSIHVIVTGVKELARPIGAWPECHTTANMTARCGPTSVDDARYRARNHPDPRSKVRRLVQRIRWLLENLSKGVESPLTGWQSPESTVCKPRTAIRGHRRIPAKRKRIGHRAKARL